VNVKKTVILKKHVFVLHKKSSTKKKLKVLVRKAGIEPALSKKLDFESSTSTNSAT
jgi:hypothetical protein